MFIPCVVYFTAMTQAVLPILTDLGVEAISVGVNTVTAPPAVPPIFNWKFMNSSVIGIWHPGTRNSFPKVIIWKSNP